MEKIKIPVIHRVIPSLIREGEGVSPMSGPPGPPVPWESGMEYCTGFAVLVWDIVFICQISHKSAVFANDLMNEKRWKKYF
jgi:hypothetical protein